MAWHNLSRVWKLAVAVAFAVERDNYCHSQLICRTSTRSRICKSSYRISKTCICQSSRSSEKSNLCSRSCQSIYQLQVLRSCSCSCSCCRYDAGINCINAFIFIKAQCIRSCSNCTANALRMRTANGPKPDLDFGYWIWTGICTRKPVEQCISKSLVLPVQLMH